MVKIDNVIMYLQSNKSLRSIHYQCEQFKNKIFIVIFKVNMYDTQPDKVMLTIFFSN